MILLLSRSCEKKNRACDEIVTGPKGRIGNINALRRRADQDSDAGRPGSRCHSDVEGLSPQDVSQPDRRAECRRCEDSHPPCAAGAAQAARGVPLGSAVVALSALATPRRWSSRATRAPAAGRAPYPGNVTGFCARLECGAHRVGLVLGRAGRDPGDLRDGMDLPLSQISRSPRAKPWWSAVRSRRSVWLPIMQRRSILGRYFRFPSGP